VGACVPWGKPAASGWEITGSLPIPVIALVAFGLVSRLVNSVH
jgi:energy-converting hydrogenase Eha subunit A